MRGRLTSGAAIALAAVVLAGCSDSDDYYQRDPYRDDRTIESSLVRAQDDFVDAMVHARSAGDLDSVTADYAAPPYRERMQHYVVKYGGRPTRVLDRRPGDDATAELVVRVSCTGAPSQRIRLTWAWFDGAWRAWPDYKIGADRIEYPGCGA